MTFPSLAPLDSRLTGPIAPTRYPRALERGWSWSQCPVSAAHSCALSLSRFGVTESC